MPDEATTPEEALAVQNFRQQMSEPQGPEQVQVINTSLGQLLDGTKIQYAPGPGRELSPAPRGAERWKRREMRRLEAVEAAKKRAQRGKEKTVLQRVSEQAKKLDGRNTQDTVEYILGLSLKDAEYAVLAEEQGPNRKGVLGSVGIKVGAETRRKFEAEREQVEELFAE